MYGNTANMVETRSEPESYEFEFMPLVTSCGSRLLRWPFTDLGLLVFMPCVGRFPTVGGTSRIQQNGYCMETAQLVPGLNEAQVCYVSVQKEFSEG